MVASPKKDWWKLAAVAAVGIVLAGLGTIVASNLAPSSPSAGPPSATTVTSETTKTDATETTVTTALEVTTTSTTSVAAAAVLEVSDTTLDLGETATEVSFQLTNTGGSIASWVIRSPEPSVTTEPAEGQIAPGENQNVSVVLDRTTVAEGELGVTLGLVWDEEELQVFITGIHALNPVIVGPRATPSTVQVASGAACSPTLSTITVRVKDTSDLAEVIVRWSNGTSVEETPMSAIDVENYEAVIGPFTAVVPTNAKIVAKDVHDNAGGAPVSLTVVACPP